MKHLLPVSVSFHQRSYQKELLDRDHIPFAHIRQNMKELDIINTYLGGHDITLDGIVKLIHNTYNFNSGLNIVEIGCGGGDNLRAIKQWAQNIKLPVQLMGIDINEECIHFAQSVPQNSDITFIHADYKTILFEKHPHIIFSSLFCHHFTDDELIAMLQWKKEHSSLGFFINDLHRHPLAYYSIKWLTQLFSKSYLVKNDAPLSVKRSFRKEDWQRLFSAAGISTYDIKWRWAFRWLISCAA